MGPQFNNSQPNFVNTVAATPDGKAVVLLLGNKYLDKGKNVVAGVSEELNRGGSWSDPLTYLKIENELQLQLKKQIGLRS
ncbi:MAG: hypothetical protein U5K54_16970 [Cytophagales bacterium]|nr:hypothetical protein [Cytophagales bacterium]